MRKVEHGGNKIHIDVKEFSKELAISSQLEDRLTNHFGVPFKREIRKRKTPEERIKLAEEYQKLIEDGTFKCKADLARHLNVSRAWITKAMKVKNT